MFCSFWTKWRFFSLFTLITICFSFAAQAERSGKDLFRLCTACHGMEGEGIKKLGAPGIAALPKWYLIKQLKNFQTGVRGAHTKDFYGMRMRPMARTLRNDKQVEAVAEYVAQMKAPVHEASFTGDATKGEGLYATCIACHGPNGEGNQAMSAPPLHISGDWYLFRQIKNFKDKLRGADPAKDPMGATMAPMAMLLADDDAIRDVLTFVRTKKK